jgi:MoxR-like ATPase
MSGFIIQQIQQRHGIVGRERELSTALAVLGAGRHLLLEGPVGVGKTTVALAVCDHLGRETVRVDGDDRYSESKLSGWFDPPLVLKSGYGEASFFPGPLVQAMREGRVLFINELNRMPESVQNVLLPALDERLIGVPHIGEVHAAPGFQVVATQNPVEYVATGHLSEALRDRFEHLALLYQDASEEARIVAAETGSADAALVETAVRLTRATRLHARFRKGASVRGAIATVAIYEGLRAADSGAAEAPAAEAGATAGPAAELDRETLRRAAEAALTTRVDLRDDIDADFAAALDELLDLVVERGEDPDVALAAAGTESPKA